MRARTLALEAGHLLLIANSDEIAGLILAAAGRDAM
jgi:hypothetical protein